MSASVLVLFVLGLGLLVAGAEGLVRGSSRLAARAGISPLVIGLTVVAYGTSTPELVVSTTAALKGQTDIAVANAVGSNILNVLLILGMCAVITPLAVTSQIIRREVPIMIVASLALLWFVLDGAITRAEAAVLLAGIVVYTASSIWQSRRESAAAQAAAGAPIEEPHGSWTRDAAFVAAGLGALVLGARWLVQGAIAIAQSWGVSEAIIGLTIVAAGTSLPEVATSIVATLRGQRDIAIGNVVGSNIYNILAILGVAGLLSKSGLTIGPAMIAIDVPVMVAVAVACLPLFFTGGRLARWEGALFVAYYVAYTAFLILAAQKHDALHGFTALMTVWVLPITAVTIVVLAGHSWWKGRS